MEKKDGREESGKNIGIGFLPPSSLEQPEAYFFIFAGFINRDMSVLHGPGMSCIPLTRGNIHTQAPAEIPEFIFIP